MPPFGVQLRKRKPSKTLSRLSRGFRYRPNIAAVAGGVTGPRPKIMTGLGTRPIPKKWKVKL